MMEAIIYRGPTGYTAALTTNSSASSYGIPVLRLAGPGMEATDCGPGDIIPSGIPAALIVEYALQGVLPPGWAGELPPMDDEVQQAANRYLMQWPDRWSGRGVIADNITLLIRIKEITQRDLAQRLGTSQAYIGQLLTPPHAKLSEAAVERVAKALAVPVVWLEDPGLAGKTVEELRGGVQ